MNTSQRPNKPRLSTAQIINMSVGFFGIQFAFGLQNANVSRIFQTLGADIDSIPILWIAAPLTGLIIQPLIGHVSDKTWLGKLGRRRPFFFIGALLGSLALFFFPQVGALWIAAIFLWILDASINVAMEPFRAFVGDMLPDEQRTSGFAMQSFFIGLGAVISSVLPYVLTHFHVSNEAPKGVIPDSVKYSFYIGAIVFIAAVLYTIFTTKEYSPEDFKKFGLIEETHEANIKTPAKKFLSKGTTWLIIGLILSALLFFYNKNHTDNPLEKELYVLSFGIAVYGLFQLIAFLFLKRNNKNGWVEIADDLNHLPHTMRKLAVVQFFTWFALFSMWIYSTPALTQHIYNTTDSSSKAYNDMANWVGVMFACYNGFAALFAFALPFLARKLSRPVTHMIALIFGGLGLISYYFFKTENTLIISMLGVGFAWASILSMPYSMLTQALPQKKMGVYMGIFNFFIVIPQILAATLLGICTKRLFHGNAAMTMVLGGVSMIVAALLTLRIKDAAMKRYYKSY
ncbi:MFS transporter [Arachidicoccus ginsenosidimutans]|uniref:MFS transporter n=1 Tax=Arachidicoccus sp. BS20 TaxID=1850526 RepID=UPI0007F06DC9|nr:MFS transporter [Arachidicoccus sp. BS20]ANI89849.1 MFS transporter [Arachidicoccus sp. BS20]